MTHFKAFKLVGAVTLSAAIAALGGCLGGSDDKAAVAVTPPVAVTPVPPVAVADPNAIEDSAGASTASFVALLAGLAKSDETSDPKTTTATFAVPADDTAEPSAVT